VAGGQFSKGMARTECPVIRSARWRLDQRGQWPDSGTEKVAAGCTPLAVDDDDACGRHLPRLRCHLAPSPSAHCISSAKKVVAGYRRQTTAMPIYGRHSSLEASSYPIQIGVSGGQMSVQRRLRWVAHHWLFFVVTYMYNLLGLNMMVTFFP
jgi:hypothetical protein